MGESISELTRELVKDSRKRRDILGKKQVEQDETDSPSPSLISPSKSSPKNPILTNRKVQLQIGKDLFESNEIISDTSNDLLEVDTKKVKKTDLSRSEKKELGYKFLEIELTPDYAKKFDSIPKSLKQSRFKKFGNTRKLHSAIDQFEASEKREKKRISKFIGLLRSFHTQVNRYRVEYKSPNNTKLLNEFLTEMLEGLGKLVFFYDALSFDREEMIHELGKRDQEAFQYFLILKRKNENGELASLFS